MRVLLNKIFGIRGGWKVNDVAADFADGVLYQELFNILFDENVDCCLESRQAPGKLLGYEERVMNWNKINAGICFNYFQ